MSKNSVANGDYKDRMVEMSGKKVFIRDGNFGFGKKIFINHDTVESYEVLDEQHQKSAASAVGRAAVGGLLLGPVGLLAGVSAKSKGSYYVAVQFKDGKRSLLEVDDKIYKAILSEMF